MPARAVLLWLAAMTVPALAAPISLRDDTGAMVTLPRPAQRIVTLAPSLTELVYAAGAGTYLVAVSAYSDFPADARMLPQVADAAGVSLESLLAIRPDLVIAWKSGNRAADIKRVIELGIPVFVVEVARLADVPLAMRTIGALAGTGDIAEQAARQFESDVDKLRRASRNKKTVSVFFEISQQPLMTINRNHAIDEVIALCRGENVFRDRASLVFTASLEELFRLQPQAILFPANEEKAPFAQYRGLKAWEQKRIYRIGADELLRTGPRLVAGAGQVCAALERARNSTATAMRR